MLLEMVSYRSFRQLQGKMRIWPAKFPFHFSQKWVLLTANDLPQVRWTEAGQLNRMTKDVRVLNANGSQTETRASISFCSS
ncbi:MAG: hypothetical protein C5B54_02605 [Acidobacteria bacterium]|nr:MAG: hypothetical protein C5B54_02605 [Acidobacteriota bacterium]